MAVDWFGLIFGNDGSGFKVPTLGEIRATLAKRIRDLRGVANLNTDPGSPFGDTVDLNAASVYGASQNASDAVSRTIFNSMTGIDLDQFLSDVLVRVSATPSQAVLWVYGTPAANFGINQPVRTSPVGTAFFTQANTVIPAAPAEAYAVEILYFQEGAYNNQAFTITVDGIAVQVVANNTDTSATMMVALVDAINAEPGINQTAWRGGINPVNKRSTIMIIDEVGGGPFPILVNGPPGTLFSFPADDVVVSTAPVTGDVGANAVSLRLFPPTGGIAGVTNVLPAIPGQLRETDSQFRARWQILQRGLGGGSPDAIKAIMRKPVAIRGGGATFCGVEYNPTDVTDEFDNLPHSLRVIVNSDANPIDIGNALWLGKAAGDNTNGAQDVVIQDAEGKNQLLHFDYLQDLWVKIEVTISVGADWPNTGDPVQTLRQDLADYVNSLQPGGKVGGVRVNLLPISTYPNGENRGVIDFTVTLSGSDIQGGPYNNPTLLTYPTVEPDANAASLTDTTPINPLTSRRRARCDIVQVFVTIV